MSGKVGDRRTLLAHQSSPLSSSVLSGSVSQPDPNLDGSVFRGFTSAMLPEPGPPVAPRTS